MSSKPVMDRSSGTRRPRAAAAASAPTAVLSLKSTSAVGRWAGRAAHRRPGTGQAPGQYLQVDFGRAIDARQVVFDTGVSTGDYPRGYTITTSTDGVNWTTAVAAGQGTGQFTTAGLSGAPVRYVRLTLAAFSGSWWSVADVRAYTASEGGQN